MAARTGNKMRLYCFVLMPFGRKIIERRNVAELNLEGHGASYTTGSFPEWMESKKIQQGL